MPKYERQNVESANFVQRQCRLMNEFILSVLTKTTWGKFQRLESSSFCVLRRFHVSRCQMDHSVQTEQD